MFKAMKFGLVGNDVSKSFSKLIHDLFSNDKYLLLSLKSDEFETFMNKKEFIGLNITKPYKKDVIKYLDELDDIASITKSVNTVINCNGRLIGYNTDYYGLKYLLMKNKVDVEGKTIAILGTGGVSSTVEFVLNELNAKKIYKVSRNKNVDFITYSDLQKKNIEVIINATPRGMNEKSFRPLFNLKKINGLETVIDLIYNPLNSLLLQEASKLPIKTINGLDMLIEQARVAEELFQNKEIDINENDKVYKKVLDKNLNIALIGMPYSGKSTIGFKLSQVLHKDFTDIDMFVEADCGLKIKQFIKEKGEKAFRREEHKKIKFISFQNNEIISCGGGVVLNKSNMNLLKQNSIIVYLRRDIDLIKFDNSRPLSSNKNDYLKLLKEREKLYEMYADVIVDNNETVEFAVSEIVREYYEIINN